MVDFETAIGAIRDNNGFTSNGYEDSYYRTYNTPKGVIQVRISNHGTHLWTWVKNAPLRPVTANKYIIPFVAGATTLV